MSETVEGIMQRIRTHIDAGITGNNVTKADFEARDASHSLGVRYGSLRLLLDEFVATKLQLASALDTIEAVKAVEEWRAREPYARRYSVSESGARAWVWHQMRWQEWRSADSLAALGRMLKEGE